MKRSHAGSKARRPLSAPSVIRRVGTNVNAIPVSAIAALTWLVLAPGCEAQQPTPRNADSGQIVFDCYYINFAWGYSLRGSYIDRDGQILTYDRKGDRWLPESVKRGSRTISAEDLLDKFRNAVPAGRVQLNTLREKFALVEAASKGKLTREQQMMDAGGHTCSAYIYDPTKNSYEEVILASDGDWRTENSAREAKVLHQWLIGLFSSKES